MKATIKFNTNEQAETFATTWTRRTLSGTTVANTDVSIYNVTDEDKEFINEYITKLNN